jgi:hypothetical protein
VTIEYAPFIIAEDEALRDMLKGMTVEDDKDANRAVGVWYGQPDIEVRDQSFPFMTIDLIDISEGTERQMAGGRVQPWYVPPPEMTVDNVTYDDWSVPYPVPVNLDYQITSFSRHPRHDRQILSQVLGNRLPFRFGSLTCKAITTTSGTDVTYDVTTRRLDMLGVAKRDIIESGKRMFMNIFTVRVSSELPSPYVTRLHKRVSTVGVGIGGYEPLHGVTDGPPSFKETFTITAPVGTP